MAKCAASAVAQTPIPDSPAGTTLQAFLEAFNGADRAKAETYLKTYDSTWTVDDFLSFRNQTGGFTLLSIERSAPESISFRVKGRADNMEAFGNLIRSRLGKHLLHGPSA